TCAASSCFRAEGTAYGLPQARRSPAARAPRGRQSTLRVLVGARCLSNSLWAVIIRPQEDKRNAEAHLPSVLIIDSDRQVSTTHVLPAPDSHCTTIRIAYLLDVATQQAAPGGRIGVRGGKAGYLEKRQQSNRAPRPQ